MILWTFRVIASLLAGLLAFCAFILLFATFVATAVLKDELYTESLSKQQAYDRIYTEVLTPQLVTEVRQRHLPDLDLFSSEDIVKLVRDIVPPDYIQGESENMLQTLSAYLNGDSDRLDLYLDLSRPLEQVKPTVNKVIESLASEARQMLIQESQSMTTTLVEKGLEPDIASDLKSLLTEENPSLLVAEFTGLSRHELLTIADEAMDEILSSPEVPVAYRQPLQDSREELRTAFAEGSTLDFLGQALRVAAQPAINAAMEEVGLELGAEERLDLTPIIARQVYGTSEPAFRQTVAGWRESLWKALLWGRILAIALFVAALGLLAMAYWKKPTTLALWVGWILVISGALLLSATLLALWILPGAVERAIYELLSAALPWAPGLASLSSDVAEHLSRNLVLSLIWPAAIPIIAGGLLLATLFGWLLWKNHSAEREARPTVE